MELKVTKSKKITFSPHQIAFHVKHPTDTFILVQTPDPCAPKLYPGSAIRDLAACGLAGPPSLDLESWHELERLLLVTLRP